MKTKIVSCHTADSKPAKQEVNDTVILPPLVFPGLCYKTFFALSLSHCRNEQYHPTTDNKINTLNLAKYQRKRDLT